MLFGHLPLQKGGFWYLLDHCRRDLLTSYFVPVKMSACKFLPPYFSPSGQLHGHCLLLSSNLYLLGACLFWMQGLCQEVKKESTGKKRWSSCCRRGRTWLWSPCPSGKTRGKREEPRDVDPQLCHLCHPHSEIQTHKPDNKIKACFATWEKILSKP